MADTAVTPSGPGTVPALSDALLFENLVDMIAPLDGRAGMVAASSARVYRDTFARWEAWAARNELSPLALNFNTVGLYLNDRATGKASLQRELAALRKLADILAIMRGVADPAARAAADSLRQLKVRATADGKERPRRALSPADADRMIRTWAKASSAIGKRNRAIVATLLLTGLRRAELATLRWSDIDFTNGVITVRHGKGDKSREAAIYGREALEALQTWRSAQPEGYEHVFVNIRRGNHFTGDRPMTATSLYRIVAETAVMAGVGHVKPHDLRRTLATELLTTGDPVHEVQAQLGHKDSRTTLNNYAVSADAAARRKSGKVRYG